MRMRHRHWVQATLAPLSKGFCCILQRLSQLVNPITLFIIITLTKQDENETQHWVQVASNKEQDSKPSQRHSERIWQL